jgi:hypothetical protein
VRESACNIWNASATVNQRGPLKKGTRVPQFGVPIQPMTAISAVQLPGWRELLEAPFHGAATPISDPWAGSADRAQWLSRGAWALAAAASALGRTSGRVPTIWLPSYFCNQSLIPLRRLDARLVFYPGDDTGAPDWNFCRATIATERLDLFVIVHYFGIANRGTAAARAFADEHGGLLLEDAAHVLLPGSGVGTTGDLVLYCPHKWLAIPDGAVLVARGRADLGQAPVDSRGAAGSAGQTALWIAKRLIQSSPIGPLLMAVRPPPSLAFTTDPDVRALPCGPTMSRLSARLLAMQDLRRIAGRRRENHEALAPLFRRLSGVSVISDASAVPYRCVLRFTDGALAESFYEKFRRQRLPVETWPDLPPEAAAQPEVHRAALLLRRATVLLPVHQSLNPSTLSDAYSRALAG